MICGIDPGKTGAIAFLYNNGKKDFFAEVHDMPVFDREINASALADLLREMKPRHTYVEKVTAFNMGRTSAHSFGKSVGVIEGVLATLKLPRTLVIPQTWKKHFSLIKQDKSASRMLATRLFPQNTDDFLRAKDDGRAEALLIAKWGEDNESL